MENITLDIGVKNEMEALMDDAFSYINNINIRAPLLRCCGRIPSFPGPTFFFRSWRRRSYCVELPVLHSIIASPLDSCLAQLRALSLTLSLSPSRSAGVRIFHNIYNRYLSLGYVNSMPQPRSAPAAGGGKGGGGGERFL